MDIKPWRLRIIGFAVVLVSFLLLTLPMMGELRYDDAVAGTLAIGIGLILLAEVGPFIKAFKAGGVELDFGESVSDQFNELLARVTTLEMAARHPERSPAEVEKRAAARPAALDREITQVDDPHKGRFGGRAEHPPYRLSAVYRHQCRNFVEVALTVSAQDAAGVEGADCVRFYLDDTYHPNIVPAMFTNGVARYTLLANHGFTVGVWVGCSSVELELDLAKDRNAPRLLRAR